MTSILIKNGRVVTADNSFEGDILIVDDKIKELAKEKDLHPLDSDTEIIEAGGYYVFPGGIDVHVHMELPVAGGLLSSDDFESGTRAAVAGGTTSIIDFVTPGPGQSLPEAARARKKLAGKSLCDYGLHMSITSWNDRIPAEMEQCAEQEGMTSVKVYMAYKETIGLGDDEILKVMDTAARLKLLVMVHCEHGETIRYLQKKLLSAGKTGPRWHPLSRPPEVEGEAVNRAVMMAKMTGCSLYIVHVSTREAVEAIVRAGKPGSCPPVLAETCPQYLLLDDSEYRRPGFAGAAYVMSPPLRPKGHGDVLWQALKEGVIRTVATDHCPFHMKGQKERGRDDFTAIPNGAAGVEHRLVLLYRCGVLENKLTIDRFVDITAAQPARIFGLYPRKGTIAAGSDADILVWDPLAEDTISAAAQYQDCDTTIFEGFPIKGKPHLVIAGGKIACRSGRVTAARGAGHYLFRHRTRTRTRTRTASLENLSKAAEKSIIS